MSDTMETSTVIIPVLLSGGAGTRLWPVSRMLRPKQFLKLHSGITLFQETVARVAGDLFTAPVAVCNEDHRFLVAEQFREMGMAFHSIILEPVARNTAPAIAAAALIIAEETPDAVMLVLPSDHIIENVDAFQKAVEAADGAARDGHLVTFGIIPFRAETGYGYIRSGAPLVDHEGCRVVREFREKPDSQLAERYIASGEYFWNSGIFLFRTDRIIDELGKHHPKLLDACRKAVTGSKRNIDFSHLADQAFAACDAISIDYAVMEKSEKVAVIPVDMSWSDMGVWSSLWEAAEPDADGNVSVGDTMLSETRNSYIRSEGPLIATIGVDGLVVVATDDSVLVVSKDRCQDVTAAVDWLKKQGRDEQLLHSYVYRPWGYYQNLAQGDGFLVKQITVNPGEKLSLQYHNHRAENWVVVEGCATVNNGDETLILSKNQSISISAGIQHRLENSGDGPLRLIEVQFGDYIGEDDIVRLEDIYGRG